MVTDDDARSVGYNEMVFVPQCTKLGQAGEGGVFDENMLSTISCPMHNCKNFMGSVKAPGKRPTAAAECGNLVKVSQLISLSGGANLTRFGPEFLALAGGADLQNEVHMLLPCTDDEFVEEVRTSNFPHAVATARVLATIGAFAKTIAEKGLSAAFSRWSSGWSGSTSRPTTLLCECWPTGRQWTRCARTLPSPSSCSPPTASSSTGACRRRAQATPPHAR